ncbi:MFS-type transporter SLC18B1-like [Corticium candelabrum]|uniref:MFS-type transporter SLC18B1-like n=1 Tax=Corticium candelabrum TaxID=121492 RepID=UPI002E257665|nr:MFS-type transporter SLC18B1-like [Corticium candelabrum]
MDETVFLLSGEERKEAARSRRLENTPAVVSRRLQFTFAALVLVCSYIILVCSCLSFSFFPQVAAHKKGSSADTEVGVYAGGNQLAVCIASFISGAYMNKIGVKFLLISGSFLVAGSSVIFGFVDDISSWKPFIGLSTVIYFVMGLGQGAFLTTCTTVFVRMFPTRIATAWSVVSLTLGLGFLTSSPLGGFLYDNTYVESELSDAVNQTPIWLLLKMMPILLACVNTFVAFASVPLIQVSLSRFLNITFHWRASQIGLVFLVFGIAFVGSSIVIGVVIDATNPRVVMIIGLLIEGCGMMLVGPSFVFSFSLQSWLVYFSMVLIGLGTCMVVLTVAIDMTATAVSRGHEENISLIAAVTGLWNAATYFSGTVAGPVGGALTTSFGFRYSTSFFAFAIFCAFIMTIVSTVIKLYHS